jgi:hypothetical protein
MRMVCYYTYIFVIYYEVVKNKKLILINTQPNKVYIALMRFVQVQVD